MCVCYEPHDAPCHAMTLRVAPRAATQNIVILCPDRPSHETWSRLRHFPGVYFIQGTQKSRKDLVRRAARGALHAAIFVLFFLVLAFCPVLDGMSTSKPRSRGLSFLPGLVCLREKLSGTRMGSQVPGSRGAFHTKHQAYSSHPPIRPYHRPPNT